LVDNCVRGALSRYGYNDHPVTNRRPRSNSPITHMWRSSSSLGVTTVLVAYSDTRSSMEPRTSVSPDEVEFGCSPHPSRDNVGMVSCIVYEQTMLLPGLRVRMGLDSRPEASSIMVYVQACTWTSSGLYLPCRFTRPGITVDTH
jgi:hypothetical protein